MLLFITCAVVLAIPAIALADNVQNDVVAGGNDTTTVGTPTTVKYEIQQTGSGGLGGCDATTASPVTVNINAPAGVTASKSSLKFTSCGAPQSVAFSSNTAGNYPITVSTVDNVGDYNTSPAAFTLHVTDPPPPANEPPTLSLPSNQTAEATSAAGAVVSYGPDVTDALRRSAAIADRVLRGARPADTPVEQASRYELVINQRSAKALGMVVPGALLKSADRVIE